MTAPENLTSELVAMYADGSHGDDIRAMALEVQSSRQLAAVHEADRRLVEDILLLLSEGVAEYVIDRTNSLLPACRAARRALSPPPDEGGTATMFDHDAPLLFGAGFTDDQQDAIRKYVRAALGRGR